MTNKRSGLEELSNKCLGIDMFGTEFKFRMPDGRTKSKTMIGVFMTLILLATNLTFVVFKLIDMRQGPVVMEHTKEDYFDIDTIFFSNEENFRFAFGMTSFDNGVDVDTEEQALYATMKAK